jgi:hypothetical protein
MEVSKCTGLDRTLYHGLRLRLSDCMGGGGLWSKLLVFLSSEVLLPVLWRSTAVRIDVMYELWVIALAVIVIGSCGIV